MTAGITPGKLILTGIPMAATYIAGRNPLTLATSIASGILGFGGVAAYYTKYPTREGIGEFFRAVSVSLLCGTATFVGSLAYPLLEEKPINQMALSVATLLVGAGMYALQEKWGGGQEQPGPAPQQFVNPVQIPEDRIEVMRRLPSR